MNEYFDEWKDEYDYSVCPRKVVYRGTLVIQFRVKTLARSVQRSLSHVKGKSKNLFDLPI